MHIKEYSVAEVDNQKHRNGYMQKSGVVYNIHVWLCKSCSVNIILSTFMNLN